LPDGKKMRSPVGSIAGSLRVEQPARASAQTVTSQIGMTAGLGHRFIVRVFPNRQIAQFLTSQTYHAVWQLVVFGHHRVLRKGNQCEATLAVARNMRIVPLVATSKQ
jgi:hypothetical protein